MQQLFTTNKRKKKSVAASDPVNIKICRVRFLTSKMCLGFLDNKLVLSSANLLGKLLNRIFWPDSLQNCLRNFHICFGWSNGFSLLDTQLEFATM